MRIDVFVLCLAGLVLPVYADEKLPLLKVGSQTYSNVTVTTVPTNVNLRIGRARLPTPWNRLKGNTDFFALFPVPQLLVAAK